MDLGIWLGKTCDTDEHYMGTSDGIFTARTCRRMPSDGQWKLDALKAVTGVPFQVPPSLPEAPTHSQPPPVPPPAPPPPAPSDTVPKAFMTVDDEQTRVHEWRRHAKRQAEVPLEDLDPAMVLCDDTPGSFGRAAGALEVIEEAEPSDLEEDDESDYAAGGDFEGEEGRRHSRLEELKKMKE